MFVSLIVAEWSLPTTENTTKCESSNHYSGLLIGQQGKQPTVSLFVSRLPVQLKGRGKKTSETTIGATRRNHKRETWMDEGFSFFFFPPQCKTHSDVDTFLGVSCLLHWMLLLSWIPVFFFPSFVYLLPNACICMWCMRCMGNFFFFIVSVAPIPPIPKSN